jgi:hypothetical protein
MALHEKNFIGNFFMSDLPQILQLSNKNFKSLFPEFSTAKQQIRITSFTFFMNRPKVYNKHMKRATDMFWIPKDGASTGVHWQFDEQYSVMRQNNFRIEERDEVMRSAFCHEEKRDLPVPLFQSEQTTDSDWNETIERRSTGRSFLAFPDGFWTDLYHSESHIPIIGPTKFW